MTPLRARHTPLMLIALAISLWLSPALTLASELHELVHELNGEHAIDASGQHHHHDDAPSRDDGDSDARDPVHLLVHCVHTCGGAVAGLPVVAIIAATWFETTGGRPVEMRVTDAPVSTLLRPPRSR